jgi:hypothetical protein
MPFVRPVGNRLTIALDERAYTLDPSTPDLLDALAYGRLTAIFPGAIVGPSRGEVLGRLFSFDDPLDVDDVERVVEGYVEHLTGWPLPAAMRLAAALEHAWHVLDGHAAAEGIDLLALPAARTLNWIYARAAEGAEYDENDHPGARARMDRDLRAPLEPVALPLLADWELIDVRTRPDRLPAAAALEAAAPRAAEPPGFTAAEQADAFRSAMAMVGTVS